MAALIPIAAIGLITAGICKFISGDESHSQSQSHTVIYRDSPQTTELLEKTKKDLELAEKKAKKSKSKHELVMNNINAQNLLIKVESKTMLLGQKGTGKTTFLWLRGKSGMGPPVDRPTPSAEDGTRYVSQFSDLFDTIGISIEVDRLMRLLALLIFKGSLPSSVILFSQRPIPDILVLSHLFINPVSVCCIVGNVTHETGNPYYSATMEQELRERGIKTLRAEDEFPRDNGLASAIDKLFPGRRLKMPDFDKLTTPLDVARATICKYVYFLQTHPDMEELAFMNGTEIEI